MSESTGDEATSDDHSDELSPRKFESLKKLASKNYGEFAMQVQHMSEDVQKKLIEQLPEFRQLAGSALDSLDKSFKVFLKSADEGDRQVHDAYREQRAILDQMLKEPDFSLDEKLRINAEIAKTVAGQHRLNAEAKAAKAGAHAKTILGGVAVIGLIAVAVTGGKFGLDQGNSDT
ncbi:hypothetical protein Q9S78_08780 [Microbacterium sp. KSW-18]|uniref:Uncharacterized protein n=1 Tax=Microbacterium aquilitoris TaxID=3067307 RepID=A0ABU3GK73_9MICO|nr:hypothetical protein [Microbacterium sp. KSW-18]MDT3330765.1 hypothetical protein [Microbacterium sp. KSW-18]